MGRAFAVRHAYNAPTMVFRPPLQPCHPVLRRRSRRLAGRCVSASWPTLALAGCLAACGSGDASHAVPGDDGVSAAPQDAADSGGPSFEVLRNEAFALFDSQGSTDEVLVALALAHAVNAEAYGVNLRMAQVCSGLRYHADAMHHYELALVQRPDELSIRRELAALGVSLGRERRALEVVEPLLADPDWVGEGTALKAMALDNLGRRAEALELLEAADALPVGQVAPCLTLHGRILHEQGDQERAYERFSAALALVPDDQAAVKGLADTSRRLGREPEADRWDEVLRLFLALRDNRFTRTASPVQDRQGQRMAGRRSEYIGTEQDAQVERLRRMIELHPRWSGAWEQLATLLRRQGDYDGACATFHELMTHHGALYDAPAAAAMRKKYCDDG